MATAKYADGTPLYRLSRNLLDRYGIEIPRSTMASWMVMVSHRCRLIMEILQRMLKSGAIIHNWAYSSTSTLSSSRLRL